MRAHPRWRFHPYPPSLGSGTFSRPREKGEPSGVDMGEYGRRRGGTRPFHPRLNASLEGQKVESAHRPTRSTGRVGGRQPRQRRVAETPSTLTSSSSDRRRALALVPVSRETEERFAVYADLLERWQRIKNLVAPSTLGELWTRHFADSAQIAAIAPEALRWADMGSGAGFPGLVVAILLVGRAGAQVHLIEANARKCAFLREAARACGAPATVHNGRVEDVLPSLKHVDVVTARALAPLPRLVEMGRVLIDGGTTGIFLKTQAELVDVFHGAPALDHVILPSVTSAEGRILVLRRAAPEPVDTGKTYEGPQHG